MRFAQTDIYIPPSTEPPELFTSDWLTVVGFSVGLALVTGLLVWIYRTMQVPRLFIGHHPDTGRPTLSWKAVVRYVVMTPIMVTWWYMVIVIILSLAAPTRTAEQVAVGAAAVVGAARLLAHIMPEASHELGKTIPLAVITIILISGIGQSLESWGATLEDFDYNTGLLNTYFYALIALDFLITGWWLWRQYSRWNAQQIGRAHV